MAWLESRYKSRCASDGWISSLEQIDGGFVFVIGKSVYIVRGGRETRVKDHESYGVARVSRGCASYEAGGGATLLALELGEDAAHEVAAPHLPCRSGWHIRLLFDTAPGPLIGAMRQRTTSPERFSLKVWEPATFEPRFVVPIATPALFVSPRACGGYVVVRQHSVTSGAVIDVWNIGDSKATCVRTTICDRPPRSLPTDIPKVLQLDGDNLALVYRGCERGPWNSRRYAEGFVDVWSVGADATARVRTWMIPPNFIALCVLDGEYVCGIRKDTPYRDDVFVMSAVRGTWTPIVLGANPACVASLGGGRVAIGLVGPAIEVWAGVTPWSRRRWAVVLWWDG